MVSQFSVCNYNNFSTLQLFVKGIALESGPLLLFCSKKKHVHTRVCVHTYFYIYCKDAEPPPPEAEEEEADAEAADGWISLKLISSWPNHLVVV